MQGGPGIAICTLPSGSRLSSVTWGADGRIVFSSSNILYEVSAQGGEPQVYLEPTSLREEQRFTTPHFLPDGRSLLFNVWQTDDSTAVEQVAQRYTDMVDGGFILNRKRASIVSHAIGVYRAGGERRMLDLPGDFIQLVAYAPTGHLLYRQLPASRSGNLWAVPFDPVSAEVIGDPFIMAAGSIGGSVSTDGTLVYSPVLSRL